MTGIVIGSVESGKTAIEMNGNGMTHETIEVSLEVIGVTAMKAVPTKATGTTAMRTAAAGGATISLNGAGCGGRRA